MRKFIFSFIFFCSLSLWSITLNAQEQEYQSIQKEEQLDNPKVNEKPNEKSNKQQKTADEDKKWKWNLFRIGGNFGLSFGSITFVELSPTFGYWVIPEKLQVGLSSKYIYQSVRYDNGEKWKSFLYGGGAFVDYVIWNGIFAHGEYELVNKESYFNTNRVNVSSLLLGGGYIQPIGQNGNFYISALFNVLDSDESIYSGTFGSFPLILKMGFGFGLGRNNNKK
ncbi:MAG: hypothetical protein M9888_02300 [Chitinophagales bacterium]|nr:hypothetical protein [Chitinophagales bacterium]